MIVSTRPLLSTVPRRVSGIGLCCSEEGAGLSLPLLFQLTHTPSAETISASTAINSPKLIQRRRLCSGVSLIVRPFQASGAALQAPSFARFGCRPVPSPHHCPPG